MTLKWTPKVEYGGAQSPLILTFPQEFWTPSRADKGGSRIVGSGDSESFLVRSDQLVNVGLRYFEAEHGAVDAWLSWASAHAGIPFKFYFDQNVASTAYMVYLHTPMPGSGTFAPERGQYTPMYRQQITLRAASGAPFTLKFFADQDPAVGLAITPQPLTGTVGASVQMAAEITDVNGADILGRTVTWGTSNPAVATVDGNGVVTFVGPGSAFITASSQSVSSTVPVTVTNPVVTAPVASVIVLPSSFTVAAGGHQQLAATLYDGVGGTGNVLTGRVVVWTSSDSNRATVDQNGYVTGIGTGGSQSGGTVIDRQDASPHFTGWNHKYTDFFYSWTTSERTFQATHIDSTMGGSVSAFLGPNPTGQHQQYALLWSTAQNGTGNTVTNPYFGHMQTWYASSANTFGASYESGFLHGRLGDQRYLSTKGITAIVAGTPAVLTIAGHGYSSGQPVTTGNMSGGGSGLVSTYYASGMIVIDANTISIPATATTSVGPSGTATYGNISNQLHDGTITPGNRKQFGNSGVANWPMNLSSPAMKAYQLSRGITIAADPEKGIFWDVVDSSAFSQAYLSVEYPTPNTVATGGPYNNSLHDYMTDLRTLLGSIRSAISPKQQWINPAAYFNFADDKSNVAAAGFGHFEQTLRADFNGDLGNMSQFVAYQSIAGVLGYEMVAPVAWTDNPPTVTSAGGSGAYTTKMHRLKGAEWVIAFICLPGPATDPLYRGIYTNMNNYWNYAPSTAWLPMWERSPGRPIVPTFTASTGIQAPPATSTSYFPYSTGITDTLGNACTTKARETDRGLFIYRACTGTTIAQRDAVATVPLPPSLTLSLLKEDNTLGPTITTVGLAQAEGVWLMKTTAPISGAFTITATSEGRTGSSAGTVGTQTVASIALAPSTAQTIAPNATFTLVGTPKDASNATVSGAVVTFTSSNTAVATVTSAGLVKGIAAGNATITASSQGVSNTLTVTVAASALVPTTIVVTPSTATTAVGSTQTFTAVVNDQFGAVMTGQTVTWASSNTGVATITSGGVMTGAAVGTVTISAAAGSATPGTASVTIATATGGGGSTTTHEPSGMTVISNRAFTTKNEDSWLDIGTINTAQYVVPATNTTYTEIGTPPVSSPNVLALVYPVGTSRGGTGATYLPGGQYRTVSPQPKQIYLRVSVFVGAGSGVGTTGFFSNHSTGINKIGHVIGAATANISFIMKGVGGAVGDEMRPGFYFNFVADSTYSLHGYAGNANATTYITRGSWHTLEFRIVASTPGVKDGICQAWCDGTLVTNLTDVMTETTGQSQNLPQMDIYPVWGSPNSNASQDVSASIPAANLYFDSWYWSGKSTLTP